MTATIVPARRRRIFGDSVTIEPVVACYMTAFTLITLTVSNLNLQKACKVNLRLADDTCEALVTKSGGSSAADEVAVQRLVAGMMMWQTCAQNVLPCLVMLLVGSWSDRTRKRVPCMMLPLYGELVRNAGQLLCVYFFDQLPMEAAGIAETIPLAVTGGQTLLTMTAYSYMGDATLVKNRTFRIGGLNAAMAISMAVGTSLSGIVYNKLGFYGAYGLSSLLIIIGLVYGWLFVEEVAPVALVDENKPFRTTITEFFDFTQITQSMKTTFKKRPDTQRLKIIVLLIILMANSGTNNGLLFTIFVLSKQLKISDEIIGTLSTISQTIASLFFAFAFNPFLFYLGPLLNILASGENISIKSLMTKLVPKSELSQIAAIFGIAEIIVSLFSGLLYNGLYEITLNTLPSAFYFITFIFSGFSIGLFLWMYVVRKYDSGSSKDVLKYEENSNLKSKTIDRSTYGAVIKQIKT